MLGLFKKRKIPQQPNAAPILQAPDQCKNDPHWQEPFSTLRKKWGEVPTDTGRVHTLELLAWKDDDLLVWWTKTRDQLTTGERFNHRGWYHLLYRPLFSGASLIDMGSGLGFDGLTIAPIARHVTFVDIVRENLELIEKLARLQGIGNIRTLYLEDYSSLESLSGEADVILANGSMHHAPMHVVQREISLLAPRLKVGGRWLQLAYPMERWESEGRVPFHEWGKYTDGETTPWAEWYDAGKLLPLFEPLSFEIVLAFNFHNNDFNWFDLVRRA